MFVWTCLGYRLWHPTLLQGPRRETGEFYRPAWASPSTAAVIIFVLVPQYEKVAPFLRSEAFEQSLGTCLIASPGQDRP
ncbi:hypothetical protein LY78DRAFT_657870 [Colletotrichum sublineola]|nr:hypothetical protein LY78DRAFT_657870 [Colletotrichum sublineola]